MDRKPRIEITATPEEHAAYVEAAKADGRSLASWVRAALQVALKPKRKGSLTISSARITISPCSIDERENDDDPGNLPDRDRP